MLESDISLPEKLLLVRELGTEVLRRLSEGCGGIEAKRFEMLMASAKSLLQAVSNHSNQLFVHHRS